MLKIFAVYDSKIKEFDKPFHCKTKGEALRSWQEVANDKNSIIGKWPQDFALFELGEYNPQTGALTNHTTPENLGLAQEYVKETTR